MVFFASGVEQGKGGGAKAGASTSDAPSGDGGSGGDGDGDGDGSTDNARVSLTVLPAAPASKLLAFDWMYHVAIENVCRRDYFTEKLLDCFLTRTVPVYWGCPNVANYFDPDGIIHIPDDDRDEEVDEGVPALSKGGKRG